MAWSLIRRSVKRFSTPSCRASLIDGEGPDGSPELQCSGCPLAYRIDDGIPVLLVDEARTRE